jgi:hypothetical protein
VLKLARMEADLAGAEQIGPAYVTHVGKESNQLEAVEAGLVHDPDEVCTEYGDPRHGPWLMVVVPVIRAMPLRALRERTGMSRSQLEAICNGHAEPNARHRDALTRTAGDYARERLRAAGKPTPRGDLEACAV